MYSVYYGDRFINGEYPKSLRKHIEECKKYPSWTEEIAEKFYYSYRIIKIGMTSDHYHRKYTLSSQENTFMHKHIDFEGTKAKAEFVESVLRAKIEKTCGKNAKNVGNDHFICSNINTIKSICNHFEEWVEEALKMYENL